ncbi:MULTISPECIES: hypothetical protein [unclassified Paenibacillus]|uniref:hypothetical protein n=1 Tax=unclassified Paenibacillus TaxID=185978 RepID=UPI0009A56DF8|nr:MULTISPECIES: hypothetical protein [unclassified Paenibacillus]SLJ98309.1 hypothetical protein SAMN06272722_102729 [Paenibacillus sp. RU5A]SOC66786.1 hypothetical protein SAMN05880581_102268 [Paenibacillus sp. RU26A]SOC70065.1 hypothetical protein SAMN05880586_102729 [Paenibacillus sp. RU5M]
MDKLKLLNSLPVIESEGSLGELEYVMVANSPETIRVLQQIGCSNADIDEWTTDDGEQIDISVIGFAAGAKWFQESKGFIDYVPENAPDWAK